MIWCLKNLKDCLVIDILSSIQTDQAHDLFCCLYIQYTIKIIQLLVLGFIQFTFSDNECNLLQAGYFHYNIICYVIVLQVISSV